MGAAFKFDNTYARELEGLYVPWQGEQFPTPQIVRFNDALALELGLDGAALNSPAGAAIFAGSVMPEGASPLAQAYAGHQFGGFSPQLGDGRAILIGEIVDRNALRRDIHLKGSGQTPFSRGGDGKAAIGPVLREYLMGEAMHALGIPTTRGLAAVTTGEQIQRSRVLPGAVLARVAASHLRVGTFEFFAVHDKIDQLRQLADYAIARHYPEVANSDTPYVDLLCAVRDAQAALVAEWSLVGFVHGVMNTDNMTISGETIDYGPCAFMDQYDDDAVFSSIDTSGRYAYGNQPSVARWNLGRFAEALLPLLNDHDEVERMTEEVNGFVEQYRGFWLAGMRDKLGLSTEEGDDFALALELPAVMQSQQVDFTLLFRTLSKAIDGQPTEARDLFDDPTGFDGWFGKWQARIAREDTPSATRAAAMDGVNPIYIPRNHKIEEALNEAETTADYSKFETLLDVLENPFEERPGLDAYALPAPVDFGPYTTFCGT